jgi:hypothetical protein
MPRSNRIIGAEVSAAKRRVLARLVLALQTEAACVGGDDRESRALVLALQHLIREFRRRAG